ncbi:MAG TPA: hypothetical protein VFG66_01520 [Gemmatimonadales bacterium]|nr:hypothetical protein [Gemmatimonadales bacterium]
MLYGIACVSGLLGERDRALAALERGIQAGFGRREWAERDPDLASLPIHPGVESKHSAVEPFAWRRRALVAA